MKNIFLMMTALFSLSALANQVLPTNMTNSWTYQTNFDESNLFVSLMDEQGSWKQFNHFANLSEQWVWSDDAFNEIFLWDGKNAQLLFDTGAPIGTRFYLDVVPGAEYAEISGRGQVKTLSGPYETVTLTFGTSVPRNPVLRNITFAVGVGIYSWDYSNPVDGLSTFTLQSAIIDGQTKDMSPAPKYKSGQLNCSFNQLQSKIGEHTSCGVKLTFVNDGDLPITFNFNDGQTYEIELLDESGNEVRKWSDGRVFTQALWSKTVAPGASWTTGDYIEMAYRDGHPLESGEYTIRIELAGFSSSAVYTVTVN